MSGPYMGSTGDQFAGVDPRELERLRAEVNELHFDARVALPEAQERFRRAEARVEQLEQINAGVVEKFEALAVRELTLVNRIEQLEQALREASGDLKAAGFQIAASRAHRAALHPDQWETTG